MAEQQATTGKKILIVVSHPNTSKSFNHALVEAAKEALVADGHQVVISDLNASGFRADGGSHDFKKLLNPDSFDYQSEQKHAATSGDPEAGFAEDILREMERLEWCDVVINHFPVWWWGVPAVHKGWIDRVLAYYWCYGGSDARITHRLAAKGWMLAITAGAPTQAALGGGFPTPGTGNYPTMLHNVNVAIPAFLHMEALPMFVVGGPGRFSAEERDAAAVEYVTHVRCFVSGTLDPDTAPKPKLSVTLRDDAQQQGGDAEQEQQQQAPKKARVE